MGKAITLLLMAALVLSLAACGGDQGKAAAGSGKDAGTRKETTDNEQEKTDKKVNDRAGDETDAGDDTPDEAEAEEPAAQEQVLLTGFAVEGGSLQYLGCEPANEGLTDDANVTVFKFDFTSASDEIVDIWDVFSLKFFQIYRGHDRREGDARVWGDPQRRLARDDHRQRYP